MEMQRTSGEEIGYASKLVSYTLAQANADGRPLSSLFANQEWIANVTARFMLYQAVEPMIINEEKELEDALSALEHMGMDTRTVERQLDNI